MAGSVDRTGTSGRSCVDGQVRLGPAIDDDLSPCLHLVRYSLREMDDRSQSWVQVVDERAHCHVTAHSLELLRRARQALQERPGGWVSSTGQVMRVR